jgi:transposase
MPWKETCVMEERMRFVLAAKKEGAVMSQLCAEAGISRQTGYRLLRRYESEGVEGLKDRSRAPHEHGRSREAELVDDVLALRAHYGWGAKKLRHKLGELRASVELPAASTIGDWLAKRGLTHKRRRRAKCPAYSQPFAAASEPNAVWTVDFKGWFRTGDGSRCDPLTLSDTWSRCLLRCQTVARRPWPRAPGVRRGVLRVRPAAGDPVGQWAAVRLDGDRRAVDAVVVVAEAWHSGSAHRAGQAPAERPARAHAPDAQAGHRQATGGEPGRTTGPVRCLPSDLQCRAATRGAGLPISRFALPAIAAALSL